MKPKIASFQETTQRWDFFESLQPILRSKNFAKILAKPFLKKKLLWSQFVLCTKNYAIN